MNNSSLIAQQIPIQRVPLRIGAADDPLEQEAEAVADRVMRMPSPNAGLIQRCPGGCPDEEVLRRQPLDRRSEEEDLVRTSAGVGDTTVKPEVEAAMQAQRGGGSPLPPSTRSFFEPRFEADLGRLRVHRDAGAAGLAASVNARAFTLGRDVFFGSGQWAPGTAGGDRLIAHELTHALQQGSPVIRRSPLPRATDYRFDTYRITREDLAREEILVRLNDLALKQLENYRDRVADGDVASFVVDIIETRREEINAVGRRVVAKYMSLPKKLQNPGGACFTVARGRVEKATREITGGQLTEHLSAEDEKTFDRIWGSLLRPQDTWLKIPDHVRGKGAPGAMVFAGLGVYVEEEAIWAGGLMPGAVIQTWAIETDAEKVRNGEVPDSYGHSFIFLRYKRVGNRPDGAIEGIEIADQGFQSGGTLLRSEYEWWIGANVTIRGTRRFVRPRLFSQEPGSQW